MPKLIQSHEWSLPAAPARAPVPTRQRAMPAAAVAQVAEASVVARALWRGPQEDGALGGVTQSMLQNYLGCRERFRVKYLLGLKPLDRWDKFSGYGHMWHACEEALAKSPGDNKPWLMPLCSYASDQYDAYPLQRAEVERWAKVCAVQFPEYVKYWAEHPDVLDRRPLAQERVFDVRYALPSGRTVRLRGKYDSVDLIMSQGGVFLQENKTKGDIDPVSLARQLRFDLQSMLYLVALKREPWAGYESDSHEASGAPPHPVCGVRYNVVRRPFSGGKGNIKQREAKTIKGKVYKTKPSTPDEYVPGETDDEFFERLRADYIAAEPDYWFFRLICRVSDRDVEVFRRQCLDPLLENLADDYQWWEWCMKKGADHWDAELRANVFPVHTQRHFRFPFGCYNALTEGRQTDYDEYLETGSEAGLRRADTLFDELQEPAGVTA